MNLYEAESSLTLAEPFKTGFLEALKTWNLMLELPELTARSRKSPEEGEEGEGMVTTVVS